jgi:predicted ABC-type ATPase
MNEPDAVSVGGGGGEGVEGVIIAGSNGVGDSGAAIVVDTTAKQKDWSRDKDLMRSMREKSLKNPKRRSRTAARQISDTDA